MDLQRTLLIVGLAVISYLMILQWQEDYGSTPPPPQTEINSQSYPQGDTGTGLPSSPAVSAVSEDLPTAPDVVTSTPEVAKPVAEPSAQSIVVETDVLKMVIDPVGGDVIATDLLDYAHSTNAPDVPFTLLANNSVHTYIAQSGLVGKGAPDSAPSGRPHYSTGQNHYKMGDEPELIVDLEFTQASGVKITKRFSFKRGEHLVGVDYLIENNSDQPWQGAMFGQIKRDGSKDPGLQDATGFGLPTYLGAAYWDTEKPYNKVDFDDIDEQRLRKQIPGGWLAMIQHYFMSAWIPDQDLTHVYETRKVKGNYIIGFTSPLVSVAPGDDGEIGARFYVGPKILKVLENIDGADGIDLAVDYGPLFFISKPLFWLLDTFHEFSNNWGVAIIMLTILVKLIFFPLSAASYRSMANMRRVQPKLVAMRERFGDDRQKMSQEMMKLYKEEKINPLGGCLPILVQMPVFLALYWALLESVELRQAPFFLWINDLSVMDPYFVLPLLMGGSMFIQQLLNPAPPDPMQARMMKLMPVIFTVFFLWFPAGLVLYWVTNNVLSIAQQWYITRAIEAGDNKAKK
ncbi:MAG: membrane protein insertase YidC [Pseudomonadales bacterium]|nr:membrane protein insertase YidC [Pseudomonadales bacterium]